MLSVQEGVGTMDTVRKFTAKNGKEITLRPARPEDSCSIIDTVRSNANERSYVLMEHYGKDAESERKYISGLDENRNLLMVAADGPDIIGCLAALQADDGRRAETAHILHVGLHLREAVRGLGIGSHLLAYAIAWAGEKGFKRMEANIFTNNKHSLGLFRKSGFDEEGVRKGRIQVGRELIDEVLMGRML